MATILLVDDDHDLVELLTFALTRAGFEVVSAAEPAAALRLLETRPIDLAVLDVDLGRWSGFDLLRDLRQRSEISVVMLTGKQAEADKVLGLELGADDYVTKPFGHRELIARIRANLRRRPQEAAAGPIEVGPLALSPAEHRATLGGVPLDLTPTEFRLLHFLMRHAGRVVPTREVLRAVWGYDDAGGADVVRVTVRRLRRKLGDDPGQPRLLHTVPGVGPMLKPEPR